MSARADVAGELSVELAASNGTGDVTEIERHVSEAFDLLSGNVFGYAITIVRDSNQAEDITQEAFLRYFCELQQGRKIREPRAWIFRVAHNLALNRQRDCRKFVRMDDAVCQSAEAPGPHIDQELEERERRDRVRAALGELSEQEKRCITMRSEGLRYREIAAILDIRISSVSNYVERAIRKIAGALGSQERLS